VSDAELSVEALIAARVRDEVEDLIRPLIDRLEAIEARLPPQLGSVADVCRVTGLSPATVRRRLRDGSIASKRVGGRLLVDLTALRLPSPDEIGRLAATARAR
jgi:hypothetical protein